MARHLDSQVLPQGIGEPEEDFHNVGVELGTGVFLDLFARDAVGAGAAVRPVRGDGVHGVGDGEDPGSEGDFLAAQAARIAVAVVVLLMAVDDLRGFLAQCSRMIACSSAFSLPGLSRMASGMAILPMS
jgi:hypothetical protein